MILFLKTALKVSLLALCPWFDGSDVANHSVLPILILDEDGSRGESTRIVISFDQSDEGN